MSTTPQDAIPHGIGEFRGRQNSRPKIGDS